MTTKLDERAGGLPGASRLPVDFHRLFAAKTLSVIGTATGKLALPLLAIIALEATPGEAGVLATLSTAAFLVIGLPAGAWVDRMRRRRVMIVTDLARFLLLASLPIAWWLDLLTFGQLSVVVFLVGVGTVFFDLAALSYLPRLVGRENLVPANSRLATVDAAGGVIGQGAGGAIVQALTAPVAVLVDAVSYLWSAGWLWRIRKVEEKPALPAERRTFREVRQGLRFVFDHSILRAIAVDGAITNFSIQLVQVMVPFLFMRELGLSALWVGGFFALGGVGVILGAAAARKLGSVFGDGRTIWLAALMIAPFGFVIPLIGQGVSIWFGTIAWMLVTMKIGVDNVLKVSFRQQVTPDPMLGRMAATMRFMLTGSLAIGGAVAGAVGEYAGIRAVLWIGAVGLAVAWIPIFLSPLRRLRHIADAR